MNLYRNRSVIIALTALLGSTSAIAAGKDVMCATVEVTECISGYECVETTSTSMAIPPFLRINFEQRSISGTRGNGEDLSAEILHLHRTDEGVLLQGVDQGLGWTMTLSEQDGSMSLAISGDLVGYMIFGNCTSL